MASHSSKLVKVVAAAMAVACLVSFVCAEDISMRLAKMQETIGNTKGYAGYAQVFFSVGAFPAYMHLNARKRLTLLVASDKALQALPESIRSNKTLLQEVLLLNAFSERVAYTEIQSAAVGKAWTSLFGNKKVTKVKSTNKYGFGLQVPTSTTPIATATVAKGNLFRSSNLYCHGVDFFFVPSK